MRAVLPGKAQAKLQAVCVAYWDGKRLVAYLSGNAFVILTDAGNILQTIYDDDEAHLEGIAIDEVTGKIATCVGSNARIYKPHGQGENALKWSLQQSLSIDESGKDVARTLSWGVSEELLVGSSWLTLISTVDTFARTWRMELANPVKFANFSFDSAYIASAGWYDRFVKIWRRLSFGVDDTSFDFSYLRHPAAVTNMHWRKPYHADQTLDNVLYTVCADNFLRIWASTDHHGLQILQQWAQIDLQDSIQARGLPLSEARFAFIIDGKDFMKATESAVQRSTELSGSHAISHLVEVANRNPEICIALDSCGRLSAWGLENVGARARQNTNIFNVAHIESVSFELPQANDDDTEYVQIYNYCTKIGGGLQILIHHFDGKIEVFETNLAELFDPSPRLHRVISKAVWTGHSGPIKKIIRNVSGRAVVSRTDRNESIVWSHTDSADGTSIVRQSIIRENLHIHRLCVMRQGKFVVFLHHDCVALWDTRGPMAIQLARLTYSIVGKPLCVLMLPEDYKQEYTAHIATITSKMKGIVWEVGLPRSLGTDELNGREGPTIREYCRFDLGESGDLAFVLVVDPAGSASVMPGFLDTFARDIALSYTHAGLLRTYTVRLDTRKRRVDWLETCSVDTGICEPALASGSSIRKAALVNEKRTELTIWDVRGAQLEYTKSYESHDFIQDLDWTSTPDDQSILAVGFTHRVILLAQMRYDYVDRGPAWASIREINMRDLTSHPIGDSAWLSGGNLMIGAGNQLFVYDKGVDPSAPAFAALGLAHRKTGWDLFEVVSRLNGPLPVYHPQFLGQCTLAGKTALVQKILLSLYMTLKYYVEGESIDNHLGMNMIDFYTPLQGQTIRRKESRAAFDTFSDDDQVETVTQSVATSINETLATIALPSLTRHEQIHLIDMVECVAIVEEHRRSMDDNAARGKEVNLSWREINFAYHSNSQDILVDMISRQFHSKILWSHARESGMFMWLNDGIALKAQFEAIARNEYTKTEEKNPVDCSLFYIALRKKTVLQGLWRMAAWNREQAGTLRLLANNFQDPRWKTVAMKNAYALLGKHRNEYAAAFFLLADRLRDCVNVILNQLKDLQLAIAITRVYEGDGGPILKELLGEKVLPLAAREGNRWLASWAFWTLHRRDMAVRALINPVYTLLESPLEGPLDIQAKLFLTDDPALVVLYSQLRLNTLQTLRGISKVTPKVEWEFVLHNARLYDRMGCDLLALDLVRNWEFLLPLPIASTPASPASPLSYHRSSYTFGGDIVNPTQLLRRRSSLVVADLPVTNMPTEMKTGGKQENHPGSLLKPPTSVFKEPEASTLLDDFGF